MQQSKGWNKIWMLMIPQKIKILMWRLCRNNVPMRNILRGKGISVPISCPMCIGDIEHLLHLFFDCKFAKDCWRCVGLEYEMQIVENAPSWFLEKLASETHDNLVKIETVVWGVWFTRNKKIFEGKCLTPTAAMHGVRIKFLNSKLLTGSLKV